MANNPIYFTTENKPYFYMNTIFLVDHKVIILESFKRHHFSVKQYCYLVDRFWHKSFGQLKLRSNFFRRMRSSQSVFIYFIRYPEFIEILGKPLL